ncbi:MAG: hypothetical protein Hyperionvirus4_55 [Hyperionvirus sp.]|uniref:Uncharacterized protein n=1 Tax=Hyperionvirus sp. TaxID=2487770 RepID=A0A3G5A759_9VIRU|nr:MAG: hypothetical protein Hyperionvirus4_55 [Hyperionvirus sp.]
MHKSHYHKKYTKYKNKYLNLKRLIGGDGDGDTEPLDILDWLDLAMDRGLLLKWDTLKNLNKGDKLELVVAIIQHPYQQTFTKLIVRPEEYFTKEIYIYPNILDGKLYKSHTSSDIAPFYEEAIQGLDYKLAVTGSGGDSAIEWENLKKMPSIKIEDYLLAVPDRALSK